MKRGTRFRGFSCAVEIDEALLKGAGMLAYSTVTFYNSYFYKDNISKICF